ncbi:biliverdin-producing heme oxygenase [Xanthomonas hyacinthi]|uniref:Biliverdin-producing heme oxygenase n=1 Tax=Xanthomonas hyacinthi TaxID=56455 RepID=A0A2S7EZY5_9XANT|nr:biliverdin-producing heme oxygenase [Xanthomonas hyacinthi]KLD73781.1 heme oxygenase [Xanthomonas hyacinthi DSM 19077]PPU98733.1 biliverdin-producing heme oxygenase [Xanthomonas hyacinthi]QGY77555.1 biliverdin-producing heme oxygenase [Xanthomonas hyacinthi]
MTECFADTTTRSQRLKAATHEAHARLDQRIMAAQPFASRANYARFVQVQYCFHSDMESVYRNPVLASVVPELAQRRRLPQLLADLADLGVAVPAVHPLPAPDGRHYEKQVDALGWLYVAEGSNLGAAILAKLAAKLGLHEQFGARHLAGHPDGRARHWRQFTAALDSVPLDPAQEQAVVAAACAAFDRVYAHVDTYLPDGAR